MPVAIAPDGTGYLTVHEKVSEGSTDSSYTTTVYKIGTDGLASVMSVEGLDRNAVQIGSDGTLYLTTHSGPITAGQTNLVILAPDGTTSTHSIAGGVPTDGYTADREGVRLASDGTAYVIAHEISTTTAVNVLVVGPDGQETHHHLDGYFLGSDSVVMGADGALYFTAFKPGATDQTGLYRVTSDGMTSIASITGESRGAPVLLADETWLVPVYVKSSDTDSAGSAAVAFVTSDGKVSTVKAPNSSPSTITIDSSGAAYLTVLVYREGGLADTAVYRLVRQAS